MPNQIYVHFITASNISQELKKKMTKTMLYINCLLCIINLIVSTVEARPPNKKSPETDDDFFTAAADMNLLLKVEDKLGRGLLRFVEKESKKLAEIEIELDKVDRQHAVDNTMWVSHPTSGYDLLKRFTKFWPSFGKAAKHDKIRESLSYDLISLEGAYPSENDLRGALSAITRIQRTYNISAREFIDGLNPVSHRLNVQEIFQMGFLWSELGDYYHAKEWLLEAVKDFPKNQTYVGFLDRSSLYEYLAWSEYRLSNFRTAIKYTRNVLKLKPNHTIAIANLEYFKKFHKEQKRKGERNRNRIRNNDDLRNTVKLGRHKDGKISREIARHNALCKGTLKMKKSLSDKLYCTHGTPAERFILKPIKIEYAFDEPNITLYHGVLEEPEMDHLKRRTAPYLNRATVFDNTTGNLTFADYRISKNAWIRPEHDMVVARLFKKVAAMTGLCELSFEPLQVANYGLAGQYEPHLDHLSEKLKEIHDWYGGNRLATFLVYLSDVERGGWTVFTKTGPGAVVIPQKGSAAFWYNLKRNGEGKANTEHAGCPVVLGQKWISNIWIHENGNRKCALNKYE